MNTDRIIVSVIVPVYNTEKYLGECMESIFEQDYADMEIILVDDGSADGSPAMCDRYADEYDNVHVIHQKNMGQGAARNNGLAAAHGKYIVFVDSDDRLDKGAVKMLIKRAEDTHADITVGGFRRFNGHEIMGVNETHLREDDYTKTVDFRFKGFYMYGHLAYDWGKLYRKAFLDENDIKSGTYPFTEDKAHNMVCCAYKPVYAFIDESVYMYRVNESSVTFRYKENLISVWTSIAEDFEEFLKEKGICEDYGDLSCFHIFFGSFFVAKQEMQYQKHPISASAALLKKYASYPIVRRSMRDLSRHRYVCDIEPKSWKILIPAAAFLFRIHAYHLFSAGIWMLRKLNVDSRITKSRYHKR